MLLLLLIVSKYETDMNYKVNLEDLTPSSSGTTFMYTKKPKQQPNHHTHHPSPITTQISLRKRLYYLVVPHFPQ